MPVFALVRDSILVLTVDGDYTASELRRVAFGAFEAKDTPNPVPVLLDMSGAAGVAQKSVEELQAGGAIFSAYRDRITGIGVVASADLLALFGPDGDFGSAAGVRVQACRSHADAREWLTRNVE